MTLNEWAAKWDVHPAALADLASMLVTHGPPPTGKQGEAYAQSLVRLEAPTHNVTLWRNNVGVMMDKRGVPVRYGLANDSERLNRELKSADLIGWRRRIITPADVGSVMAQFVSRECKAPGWRFNPNDEREVAQLSWAVLVTESGGDAKFVTGTGSF